METKEVKPNNNLSQAGLMQLADDFSNLAERDLVLLAILGVTAEMLATLRTKNEEYKNMPADTELLASVSMTITDIKSGILMFPMFFLCFLGLCFKN